MTTYHGIDKAVCLNCGKVTTDDNELTALNDAPPGPECRSCGVHDILWTLASGKRAITTGDDEGDTVTFNVVRQVTRLVG